MLPSHFIPHSDRERIKDAITRLDRNQMKALITMMMHWARQRMSIPLWAYAPHWIRAQMERADEHWIKDACPALAEIYRPVSPESCLIEPGYTELTFPHPRPEQFGVAVTLAHGCFLQLPPDPTDPDKPSVLEIHDVRISIDRHQAKQIRNIIERANIVI